MNAVASVDATGAAENILNALENVWRWSTIRGCDEGKNESSEGEDLLQKVHHVGLIIRP